MGRMHLKITTHAGLIWLKSLALSSRIVDYGFDTQPHLSCSVRSCPLPFDISWEPNVSTTTANRPGRGQSIPLHSRKHHGIHGILINYYYTTKTLFRVPPYFLLGCSRRGSIQNLRPLFLMPWHLGLTCGQFSVRNSTYEKCTIST